MQSLGAREQKTSRRPQEDMEYRVWTVTGEAPHRFPVKDTNIDSFAQMQIPNCIPRQQGI